MTPNILILIGGLSERMGRNKALIERPDGTRQIDHIVSLAKPISSRIFLSSRDSEDHGTGLPVIPDLNPGEGPVGALASAAASGHSGPWLVIGCDLFLLDVATLRYLLAAHDPSRPATAFRNRIDSRPEPLCAIYEESSIQGAGAHLTSNRCARRFLESLQPQLLELPHPAALDNANTPAELAEVFQKMTHGVVAKSVSVLYFAALREQRGASSEAVETLACTAAGLYEELSFRHRLKLSPADLRVARNGEFAEWDATVANGDEFVFIPPVAGG
jgi:molybdopterin-guanine dinucleotide biosynthesis protein A/molybdopterin converting factor small subunit